MRDVRPSQVWEMRTSTHAAWHRVKVISATLDAAEIQYLNPPGSPVVSTFRAEKAAMLATSDLWRLLSDAA
jgi:hypothetical protein